MEWLSDDTLIDAYKKAFEMDIEEDFRALLIDELNRRGINLFRIQHNQESGGEHSSES